MKTIYLNTVDSTNIWAKKNILKLDPNQLTAIVAEEQTKGKGRLSRGWLSPKGNIYMTFYFRLPKKSLHFHTLAQVLCLSCASVLIKEGLEVLIKWPNDILIHNKKVAGVLCETSFINDSVDIFLGIGINVNMSKEMLMQIDKPATSLSQETKTEWNKKNLLEKIQKQFEHDLEIFKQKGFEPFHAEYENLLAYKGKKVTCTDGNKKITGLIHSITYNGELNLYNPETKKMQTLLSGDISLFSLHE